MLSPAAKLTDFGEKRPKVKDDKLKSAGAGMIAAGLAWLLIGAWIPVALSPVAFAAAAAAVVAGLVILLWA